MMKDEDYIPRLFDQQLDFYLKSIGAIVISGPKFCGKSTTAKRHAKTIVDLTKTRDREQYVDLAKNAIDHFLNLGPKPQLIDEWQIVSFIWNDLKETINDNRSFGQYILTGSVTDRSLDPQEEQGEKERHTGTGRIVRKMMRTLSLFESGESNGTVSLSKLKEGAFQPSTSDKNIDDYAFYICRGGWPLAINQPEEVALQQAINFFEGLVCEDLFALSDVPLRKDEQRARKFLRAYARSVSSQTANESMKADIEMAEEGMDKGVFAKYLLALQRLYVSEELAAWNPNLRSKTAIRTKNTRHFVDPSIAAAALGVGPKGLFSDMKTFGLLFESLAIRDLRVYCDTFGANLYHYRDKLDREADAVIQFRDGDWALIEVKMGDQEDIDDAAKKLLLLSKDIKEEKSKPAFLMIITKDRFAYRREDGVYVVPLACLRN